MSSGRTRNYCEEPGCSSEQVVGEQIVGLPNTDYRFRVVFEKKQMSSSGGCFGILPAHFCDEHVRDALLDLADTIYKYYGDEEAWKKGVEVSRSLRKQRQEKMVTWSHIENFPHYFKFESEEAWNYFLSTIPYGCNIRTRGPEHYPCLGIFFGGKFDIDAVEWLYTSDFSHEDGYRRDWEVDEDSAPLTLVKSKEELNKIISYYESFSTRWLLDNERFPYYVLVQTETKPNEDKGEVEIEFLPIYKDALFD